MSEQASDRLIRKCKAHGVLISLRVLADEFASISDQEEVPIDALSDIRKVMASWDVSIRKSINKGV